MNEFARLGYFIVKYIDNFELDSNSGLDKNAQLILDHSFGLYQILVSYIVVKNVQTL